MQNQVLEAETAEINHLEKLKANLQESQNSQEIEAVKNIDDKVLAKVLDVSDQILTNPVSNPDEVSMAKEIKVMDKEMKEELEILKGHEKCKKDLNNCSTQLTNCELKIKERLEASTMSMVGVGLGSTVLGVILGCDETAIHNDFLEEFMSLPIRS